VEDTWNLIGRALSLVVDCAAKVVGVPREQVVEQAELGVLRGKSIKAALDIDWDDPQQQREALRRLLDAVGRAEAWVAAHAGKRANEPPLKEALEALRRVLQQDLEPDPTSGDRRIRRGVAKDRLPSMGDREMRHGRKSKAKPFTGYKRHIAKSAGYIVGACVQPANRPEHEATAELLSDAKHHGEISELHIDRGFLGSPMVEQFHQSGGLVLCKPWPSRNHGRFTKLDFRLDLDGGQATCPAGVNRPIAGPGSIVRFPPRACRSCELRARCTLAAERGRSLAIHRQERLLVALRQRRRTRDGRAALRERVTVEHSLASIAAIQGPKARYKGTRKNTFDLRRCAAVANLQVLKAA